MRILLALLLSWCLCVSAQAGERTRWVLAVGTHQGGPGQDKLRHARDDAADFVDVMLALGGVEGRHVTLLEDADVTMLRAGLAELATATAAARAEGRQPEIVFYYSGHSDERGLTPWGELLPWAELRSLLAAVDADVRIAVLDSCASGSFVALKGGAQTAGFLQDRTDLVAGDAVLMSASADESAQESDRLGGSYFTHHLVAGLRGAADTDEDRKVTVQEAFTYANDQTVRSTELSWVGAQHPYYNWDLTGRGELVLTDLRQLDARIQFDAALDGEISVRDDDGELVAELYKGTGLAVSYAVPTGRYTLRLRTGGNTFKARVHVSASQPASVDDEDFELVSNLAMTRLRGDSAPTWKATHPISVHLSWRAGSYGRRTDVRTAGVALNLLGVRHPEMRGWDLGTWSWTTGEVHGASFQGAFSGVHGHMHGLQLAPATMAGSLEGTQWGLVNHVASDARGFQWGVVNWTEGSLRGLQIGAVSVVKGVSVRGHTGAQLSMLYNRAGHGFRGLQLATFNDAEELHGAQLGVFNVAQRMSGFQLGLVNIAQHLDGESLGLFNAIANGYHNVEVFSDDMAYVNLGLKTGGRHLYTRLRLGIDVNHIDQTVLTHIGLGLGAHWERDWFSVDTDFNILLPERTPANLFTEPPPGIDMRQDLSFGFRFTRQVGLFLGPALSMSLNYDGSDPHERGNRTDPDVLIPSFTAPYNGGVMRLWPGYQVGLRVGW